MAFFIELAPLLCMGISKGNGKTQWLSTATAESQGLEETENTEAMRLTFILDFQLGLLKKIFWVNRLPKVRISFAR